MPILVLVAVVAIFIAWMMTGFTLSHLIMILVGLLALGGIAAAVFRAISKGVEKRNARLYPRRELPAGPRRPQIPQVGPADRTWNDLPEPHVGAFSSGEAYEEAAAVPEDQPRCEGPGCFRPLPERPWKIGLVGSDESHSFCSEYCTNKWAKAEDAKRAKAGR